MNRLFLLAAAALGVVSAGCRGPVDPAARAELLARRGTASVTVYPVFVRTDVHGYSETEATRIGEYLAAEQLAQVVVTPDRVDVPGEWGVNQSRMFRDSVEALRAHVERRPPATDYALLAEYLIGSRPDGEPLAVGIHCYVMTRDGRLALGVGLNSHHKLFAEAQPITVEECTAVLLRAIDEELCNAPASQRAAGD